MSFFEFYFCILEKLLRFLDCRLFHKFDISINCVFHIFLAFTSLYTFWTRFFHSGFIWKVLRWSLAVHSFALVHLSKRFSIRSRCNISFHLFDAWWKHFDFFIFSSVITLLNPLLMNFFRHSV